MAYQLVAGCGKATGGGKGTARLDALLNSPAGTGRSGNGRESSHCNALAKGGLTISIKGNQKQTNKQTKWGKPRSA